VKATLPGPRAGFFFGSGAHFRRDQLGFYEMCAREYGDLVQTRMGPFRTPSAIAGHAVARGDIFIAPTWVVQRDRRLFSVRRRAPSVHRQQLCALGGRPHRT
jgi:hypothetical protein